MSNFLTKEQENTLMLLRLQGVKAQREREQISWEQKKKVQRDWALARKRQKEGITKQEQAWQEQQAAKELLEKEQLKKEQVEKVRLEREQLKTARLKKEHLERIQLEKEAFKKEWIEIERQNKEKEAAIRYRIRVKRLQKKNGLILIPKVFKSRFVILDKYMSLFNLIKKELNYGIVFTDDYNVNKIKTDTVVVFKNLIEPNPYILESLQELPEDKKLIVYSTDISDNSLFDRADKILCPYDCAFRQIWDEYVDKYEFFPQFFAPYLHYAGLKLDPRPAIKCVLSGNIDKSSYPLRAYINKNKNRNRDGGVVILKYPNHKKSKNNKISIEYAKQLHRYFCGIATSSNINHVTSKYFEIPAAGALLLANGTPDLVKLGFVPDKHYVNITEENVFNTLGLILKGNYKKYEHIRRAGRKFVLENFSEVNRFEQFKNILEEL